MLNTHWVLKNLSQNSLDFWSFNPTNFSFEVRLSSVHLLQQYIALWKYEVCVYAFTKIVYRKGNDYVVPIAWFSRQNRPSEETHLFREFPWLSMSGIRSFSSLCHGMVTWWPILSLQPPGFPSDCLPGRIQCEGSIICLLFGT
jgi:hypothetical protein